MSTDEFTLDVRVGQPLSFGAPEIQCARTGTSGLEFGPAITITINTSDRCAAARISATIFD